MPLSVAQQRLWVLEQLHPGKGLGNVGIGVRLPGAIDGTTLEKAVNGVVQRHAILRREFQVQNGTPAQIVSGNDRIEFTRVDLRNFGEVDRHQRFARAQEQAIGKAFDLTRGPLVRAMLILSSGTEQVLLLVAHRIVCDQASLRILAEEIAARIDGHEAEAGNDTVEYDEVASRQLSPEDVSFWKGKLSGVSSTLDLPTDRARPATQSFRGAKVDTSLEAELTQRLGRFAQKHNVTPYTVLLAAFQVLLARYTRQEEIMLGTTVPGRTVAGSSRTVGPLENLLPLRTAVATDLSFTEFLSEVGGVVGEAYAHQGIPFETLLTELRLDRDMSRHPLFQVLFEMPGDSQTQSGSTIFEVESQAEQFDLRMTLRECSGKLDASFRYSCDLFDDSTIQRLAEHYRILLEAAIDDPSVAISCLPMLSEAERNRLLVEWNDTHLDYPRNIPLHQLIETQAAKTPDAVALVYESQHLSYRELNGRANQLARYLQKNGVGPDTLVGVCAERSIELVIALLASMKAGGAYVPLDPEYPKDRLETMLADANPPVVLTQTHLLDRVPSGAKHVFVLDRDWNSLKNESTADLAAQVGGKNLAYTIYTSGSTGKPKGVPNVHEAIVNRLLWMQDMYQLTGNDRVLQKTPFSFDVSVWEFFWPLLTGATLVMAKPGGHRDPAYLVNIIAEQRITTLHFVPSMLSIFLETTGLARCASIRQVFASGEALPYELQQRFFSRMGNAELHNLYGPTEAAVDVTYWPCTPDSEKSIVPIGRPVANTQIYVLDPNLQPTPIGVPGELHIGGIQLARGYLNRPELTAEKFIPDPFSKAPGARLYKTGDLARFLPDGNVEYLGRTDFQVKLRGLRIELGEIESVLGRCDGVRQAVVVVREDQPGDKRLVAYVIPAPGIELEAESLKKQLKDRLPEYMVPSRFVFVEKFPMTTSGKVDRKILPAPPVEQGDEATRLAPRNDIEAMVADLFAKVLGLPAVGVTDNFFDLGGHSLLAGRLLAQIHETTGRQIPLSAMFRASTVESLARMVAFGSDLDHDPVVMEIQPGDGIRVPFFAIVPPGEESLGYAMLARHMGPEQTVYKIQGHSPVTEGKRPYSEEEMRALVDEYVAAMRSVRPHGPYCVGGFCDGTHIAEQVVLRLESEGEEVGLFAIFDTWVLQHSQNRFLWKIYYYGQRVRQIRNLSVAERLASYKKVAANKMQNLVGSKPSRTDWRQTYWPEGFRARRFQAPVVLFKRPKQPFYYINDAHMGWAERSQGGVTIHEVDFHHAHILREPHVAIFGTKLAEHMAQLTGTDSEESMAASVSGRHGE